MLPCVCAGVCWCVMLCHAVLCFVQSYYGAALCVCWSPDAAFVASGGEDDLVATYSVAERQVRGGHGGGGAFLWGGMGGDTFQASQHCSNYTGAAVRCCCCTASLNASRRAQAACVNGRYRSIDTVQYAVCSGLLIFLAEFELVCIAGGVSVLLLQQQLLLSSAVAVIVRVCCCYCCC